MTTDWAGADLAAMLAGGVLSVSLLVTLAVYVAEWSLAVLAGGSDGD